MIRLSTDDSFNFELLRLLSHSTFGGADVGEVLTAGGEIAAGDFESWHAAFDKRAECVLRQAEDMTDPTSVRDAMFRAATYSRGADFFLHHDWDDPRIASLWARQTACFDRAIALLDVPGYRGLLPADGFRVPIIFFPARKGEEEGEGVRRRRPTIVMGNGYDGSMEEMYHMHGVAALERGYNVVCYDGPGQPSVRRDQGLGFIHEWERVVSPVMDYLETVPCVDMRHVGLLGYSMAGVLAARAAAFEPRVKAVFQIDGLYSFAQTPVFSPQEGLDAFGRIDDEESTRAAFTDAKIPAGLRWALSHGLWAFRVKTRAEFREKAKGFTIEGFEDRIRCPVFVGDAANDMFFKGQPQRVKEALGDRATLVTLTDEDAAGEHCHFGAGKFINHLMYKWFEEKVVKNEFHLVMGE